MNIADSSAWLEYQADTNRTDHLAPAIEDCENLIVLTISIHEVYKKVLREMGEDESAHVMSLMSAGRIVDFDSFLTQKAARLSLPLADSTLYAALSYNSTLWTQDSHFEKIQDVHYFINTFF